MLDSNTKGGAAMPAIASAAQAPTMPSAGVPGADQVKVITISASVSVLSLLAAIFSAVFSLISGIVGIALGIVSFVLFTVIPFLLLFIPSTLLFIGFGLFTFFIAVLWGYGKKVWDGTIQMVNSLIPIPFQTWDGIVDAIDAISFGSSGLRKSGNPNRYRIKNAPSASQLIVWILYPLKYMFEAMFGNWLNQPMYAGQKDMSNQINRPLKPNNSKQMSPARF